jgi:Cu-Zn family superoxide dismutase
MAISEITGSDRYRDVKGLIKFYQTSYGVVVSSQIRGLPKEKGNCTSPIFAFHIHEGDECTGNATDPFANVRMHYNPYKCPHPYHAGDLPPLFGANGHSYSVFLIDRFNINDVIGRTVVIHASLDDFSSQPAGNAGEKIACGRILPTRR